MSVFISLFVLCIPILSEINEHGIAKVIEKTILLAEGLLKGPLTVSHSNFRRIIGINCFGVHM